MKSNWLFYLGVTIDAFVLLLSASNTLTMYKSFKGIDGATSISPMESMPVLGRILLWLIPIALLTLIGGAFWLKAKGKMLAANILLWVPALPTLVITALWAGLALLFILFGN